MATDKSADTTDAYGMPRERPGWLTSFFFPKLNLYFVMRLALVALLAYLVFGHICIPAKIAGKSMEPTYRDGGFTFCWRPRYWVHAPEPGNVVMIRLAGKRVMYLKRVVAVAGDTVAFRNGKLLVNGEEQSEPYVRGPCDWDLAPRTVPPGQVYVVGDNRSMPMEQHNFGKVDMDRIEGGPLW